MQLKFHVNPDKADEGVGGGRERSDRLEEVVVVGWRREKIKEHSRFLKAVRKEKKERNWQQEVMRKE